MSLWVFQASIDATSDLGPWVETYHVMYVGYRVNFTTGSITDNIVSFEQSRDTGGFTIWHVVSPISRSLPNTVVANSPPTDALLLS